MSVEQKIHIANVIKSLHKDWDGHKAQNQILNAIFHQGKKRIGIECGRKFGKTELVCYILWRVACMVKNAECYYFAPTGKQAKELIWANSRIQRFGASEYLAAKPNETELRMKFTSGAFIKLDGSESYEAYRGIGPDIFIYDEFKDFHPKFHPAMEPNRAAKANKGMGIHIVLGTPPEVDCHPEDPDKPHPFYELMDEIRDDPDGAYFNFTSYSNPHIPASFIDGQREKYTKRGDLPGFMREYMAKRVKGGPGAIFPMFDKRVHVKAHDDVLAMFRRDWKHMEWEVIADPGTESVFGCLFMAINPYNQKVYILDEIYAKSQAETSTGKIIPAIRAIREDLNPNDDWVQIYDEAASWFCNEAGSSFHEAFLPTHKSWDKKQSGLSLIKDQLIERKAIISDRCVNLIWEMENYQKDKNGRIPKKNDHLVDCYRYGNAAAGLRLPEEDMPEEAEREDLRRGFSMKEDIDVGRDELDFLEGDSYD